MDIETKTRLYKLTHPPYQNSIETIFSEFLELDTAAREAALKKLNEQQPALRAELESLLSSADKAEGFLSLSPVPPISALEEEKLIRTNQSFGSYQIIRELGYGGMGTVFLAERADGEYCKQVAIKMVNCVVNTELNLRRFIAERQILANLEHPNIACLLDGGTTEDGRPYLVMEYIQGEPIDLYCRTKQLAIRDKLELFIKVCTAVHYAHQNLIVHRDLKPANILITAEGIPKLLDFGIAKLLESEHAPRHNEAKTLADFPLMTPEYASPEQLLGDTITTATDVYALGIILYELLTGHRPYQLPSDNIVNIAQTICEHQVPPPSSRKPELRSQLQGDLDNIILFALRKEPKLRYQSVQNFAADIECHLKGKPVNAVKDTLGYRVTKFVKRNKLVVNLSGLALFSLLSGIILSTWQWQVAQAEQKRAEQHYEEVRELANTMVFEVTDAVAELPGSTQLRRSLLDKGVVYLDRLTAHRSDDPDLQREVARAYYKLALVQGDPIHENLGNTQEAGESLTKAIAIWKALVANDPTNLPSLNGLARSYKHLSVIHGMQGKIDQALNLNDRCITLLEKHLPQQQGIRNRHLIGCYTGAAHWLTALGDIAKAKQYLFKAIKTIGNSTLIHALPFKLRILLGRIHEELAEIAAKTGDLDSAVANERIRISALEALPIDQRKSRRLADAYQGLAARLAAAGDINNALQAYQHGLTLWSERAKKYPEDVRPRQGMAGIYAELSRLHIILANQVNEPESASKHRNISCDFYQRSQQLLEQLPEPGMGFGARYSWLSSPEELMQSLAVQCRSVYY